LYVEDERLWLVGNSGGKAETQRRRGSDVSDATDTHAQAVAGRETGNGLRRHPDLSCIRVSKN